MILKCRGLVLRGRERTPALHLRNVRISSTRQLPNSLRIRARHVECLRVWRSRQEEKSFFRTFHTAGVTALLAPTGVAGVEYSGSAAKIRSGG